MNEVYSSFVYTSSFSDSFNELSYGTIKKENTMTNLSSDFSILIIIYMNFK